MSQKKMKPVCLIPARGGSKGVKNKNIKLLAGKPLLAHAIELAKNSSLFSKIIVTTDNEKIANVAKKYGAEVIKRPKDLAMDDTSMNEVLLNVVSKLQSLNYDFEILVNLDCTVPFIQKSDLQKLIQKIKQKSVDTSCLVYNQHHNPYFNIVEKNNNGYLQLSKKLKKNIYTRQRAPIVYQLLGIFAINISQFLKFKKIYMSKTVSCEILPEKGLMIDTPFEFKIAELMMKNKKQLF